MSYSNCSRCRRDNYVYPGCPCGVNFLYLPPGYGNYTIGYDGCGYVPVPPVNPPTPVPSTSAYLTSASASGFSISIPSGGGAIPTGSVTLPVANTATILPLNVTSMSAGLSPVAVIPGTQAAGVQADDAGFYRFDANACFGPVDTTPSADDFRVLYAYVYSAAGVLRQSRAVSMPAVGSSTPTCVPLAGGEYLNAGDRLFFAVRQTSVNGQSIPLTVFRASVART